MDMKKFAAGTHKGMKRDHNEDCFEANADLNLWLIADGVGGHSFGEVASALVKTTLVEQRAQGADLLESIFASHRAVLAEISKRGAGSNMGSTVVAMTLTEGLYDIAWVGDSRAYLWDGAKLSQITVDHSHVSALVAEGVVSQDQAKNHPDRHVLTQSIGVSSEMNLNPGRARGSLENGQQILMCSDGLTDELSDKEIAQMMHAKTTPQGQVDGLINAALAAGGSDNVTAVVVGKPSLEKREVQGATPDLDTTYGVGQTMLPQREMREERRGRNWAIAFFFIAILALIVLL